ncbi:MAG TPA: hypothetical protein VMR45_04085 [Patescibacteria group bacterium]|nr:hypothetical protein [Patescibacteria group bacterium]
MSEGSTQQKTTVPPSGWHYNSSQASGAETASALPGSKVGPNDQKSVSWTASEFIVHHKTVSWYAAAVLAGAALSLAIYFITRDYISTGMVAIMVLLFCAAASRPPRVLMYSLTPGGISIGQNFHAYGEFQSFSVEREGAFANIELVPLHRFMPLISVYCSPENEDQVISTLSEYVPFEQRTNTYIERFFRTIRF